MGKYLKLFDKHSSYTKYINDENNLILPNVSLCESYNEVYFNPKHDYSKDYFTVIALGDGTIFFNIYYRMGTEYITSISYSIDNGETWITTNNTDNKNNNIVIEVQVEEGDKVLWKGDAKQLGIEDDDHITMGSGFSADVDTKVEGNIMSLLYEDDFKDKIELEYPYAFCNLFFNNDTEASFNLFDAENLILPAKTLSEYCYAYMFCRNDDLRTAPKILATTLAPYCCLGMFLGSGTLITAPELPATTLAPYCYQEMFSECTSLTEAPELPATTLSEGCYTLMFNYCVALQTAPELPAINLVSYCYHRMFLSCSNLKYIKAMFITKPGEDYTDFWVDGVCEQGTFVKNNEAEWEISGHNGIPSNWDIQTE